MNYTLISTRTADDLVAEVNSILEDQGKEMEAMHLSRLGEKEKLVFRVEGTRNEHTLLMNQLRQSSDISNLETTPGPDRD
jgi:glycine cleavage system regulatory protein